MPHSSSLALVLLVAMTQRGWPVDLVQLPVPVQNKRGIEVLEDLGLEVVEQNPQRQVFAWRRVR